MLPRGYALRGHSLAVFPVVLAVLTLAVSIILHVTAAAPDTATLWIADQKQLKRVDPAVNQYVQAITLANAAEAIAFDAKSNVLWALANKHLLKFDASGVPLADYDLTAQAPPADALKRLVLDPYDASLWVAGEKTVLHVNTQGQILLKWTSSQNLQAIALDPDQSLWVLTQNDLYQLSVTGTVLSNLALPNTLLPDPSFLAVDGLGGYLWVAGKKTLIRLDANDLTQPPVTAPLLATVNGANNKLEALLTHPIFGTVWAASTDTLLLYDRDAALIRQTSLTPQALGIPQAIAYEYGSASLWLGGKAALGRFTPNGDFVTKLPADIAISAIATGPFAVSPTLTLLSPLDNSLTNNPRPPFRLGLGAECNGSPCTLVDAYTQAFSLDATLNGITVGSLFTLANREALYLPPTRLPEGLNLFGAQAKDVFGHLSNRINSQVTIDTIPPTFLSVAPADGSTLTTATVTVSGKLDDPTASVMLQNATGTVLNVGNATFSFNVTLAQGLNTFTLTAQDPAGNVTSISYRLTLITLSIKITSPAPGSTLTDYLVPVHGTLTPPPTKEIGVTVNGQAALVQGGQFSALVAVDPQMSSLTAMASDATGALATDSIGVTVQPSTAPALLFRALPAIGVTPLAVEFSLASPSSIAQVSLDLKSNGSVDFQGQSLAGQVFRYSAPGLYLPKITVTDTTGAQHTATTLVQVYDSLSFDALMQSKWRGMKDALRQGNIDRALDFIATGKRPIYRRMFNALGSQLAQIDRILTDISLVELRGVRAEYEMLRTDNGVPISHFVLFVMDEDGIWRIKFF